MTWTTKRCRVSDPSASHRDRACDIAFASFSVAHLVECFTRRADREHGEG